MRASDKKSSKTLAQQYADLKKLGDQLAGKDLKRVTDKTRKATAAKRQASLKDAYLTQRGGGQGKAAPTGKLIVRPKSDFGVAKMNTQQKREFLKGTGKVGGQSTGTWDVSAKKK